MKKYLCELFGTFVLVLFGCGVAVLTHGELVATSLAFGLSIVALAYVIGSYSGCHVNPAITISMLIDKRISAKDAFFYIISQVVGAIFASALLILIIKSSTLGEYEFVGLGTNGYDSLSAAGLNLIGALAVEVVLTFVFVFAVLGVTKDDKKASVAPIVIGLTLTFVHLLGIKLTGTSVNPARSLAPAIFMGGEALKQVWVFIVAPIVGGILASIAFKCLNCDCQTKEVKEIMEVKEEVKKVETKKAPKKETKTTTKKTTKKVK